ncbi:MAG TPA: F0F1 ATP synthase subunit B [Actinocrinis sp.]|uniref:F0F1 ATP synthase subunit B n=1 Tax=Actinocrinis sp. TaxID=1920516 RepID=UPI002D3A0F17|nr:F0F1 ATP synthase subunit B [Actinocrinis sp.]HZU57043.1 F0F1 ATP synthase subunit B [Actinocrinis sp.]
MGPQVILADHNPVLPDGPELILGIIAFAIVFFFLYAKALPGIKKLLEERTEAIEGGLLKAEAAQAEAERIKADFTARLAESRHEAAEVRAKAQAEGAALVDKAREEANRQRESIVAAGHAQLAADRNSAVAVLKADLGKLAVELADKIVGERAADATLQERIIDRFLDELDGRLGVEGARAGGAGAAPAAEQVG